MKKLTQIISICCLGFLLAACGTQENTAETMKKDQTETLEAETQMQQPENQIPDTEMQIQNQETGQDTQNGQVPVQTEAVQPETTQQPGYYPEAGNIEENQEENLIPSADWNGTFSKGDEQVVLAAADSTSFEFRFSVSGIAGVARTGADSSVATFTGDDGNVITFGISGSVLSVSVTSPDVEGESASTIGGTYELTP